MLDIKKLLAKLLEKPVISYLSLDSAWTSGTVSLTLTKDFVYISLLNIRRNAATNGYIKVASLPSGVNIGSFVSGVAYINDGSNLKGGAFRIRNGNIEYNTSAVVPTYGAFATYTYVRG